MKDQDPITSCPAAAAATTHVLVGCDLHAGHRIPAEQLTLGPHRSGEYWLATYVCPDDGRHQPDGRAHVNVRRVADGRPARALWAGGARIIYVRYCAEFADPDRARIAAAGPFTKTETELAAVFAGDSPWQQQLAEEELARWLEG